MKIGLIIHSVTGNTLHVAKELQKRLVENGHEVILDEIKTEGKVEFGTKDVEFKHLPDLNNHELLIFGSHTEAFQLETAMKIYFEKIEKTSVNAICFATHQFPLKCLGGTGTVKKMKSYCEIKGMKVNGTCVINWSPESKRKANIEAAIEEIIRLI